MELGPIFRALMYNKARFWLITVEVALTLAIVANCINNALDLRRQFLLDTGIDEESIVVARIAPFGTAYQEEAFIDDLRERDLAALAAIAGVRQAAATHAVPLSGSGSATGRKPLGSELDLSSTPYFGVTQHYLETLDAEIVAGRDFVAADFDYPLNEDGDAPHRNVILSQALADVMFPDGGALGQVIQNDEGEITDTIIGIAARVPNAWPRWREGRERAMLFPSRPGTARRMSYLIGVEPEAVDRVFAQVEPQLLALDGERLVEVRTLAELKQDSFASPLGMVKLLGSVIVLLVLVTALGIVGLTGFSVSQRVREIGTRRALGATKSDIVRYFLVENYLVTTVGLALGVALTFALNVSLVHFTGAPRMPWQLVTGGMVMLWATGVLAALAPAWRASRVAPEVATRTV